MTIKAKHIAVSVGALLSAMAFSVAADTTFGTGGYNRELHTLEQMKMLDANGDHMVSSDEFTKYYETLFDELDTDHDGSIDAKEWVGVKGSNKISIATGGYSREMRTMKMMGMMDADSDHKVTKDEFISYHQKLFDAMDKKGNKMIDPQEWLARQTGNK